MEKKLLPATWHLPDVLPSVLVKICGLTSVDNALECVSAGADIIGLVFFKKSPRHVEIDQARQIAAALPVHVPACGVFVNETVETVMNTAKECGLGIVQLHGSESPQMVQTLSDQGLVVIKAFFAAAKPTLDQASCYPCADFCLAEYGKGILPGGNAETWDYTQAKKMGQKIRLMLAGGLHPENVSDAVKRVAPFAVDVSSGVEKEKGVKDISKVEAFIKAAKSVPT